MPTTSERRQPENAIVRDRVREYLDRNALGGDSVRVVPLTGDASDRRYFRLLLGDEPSRVLSLYPGAFEYDAMPFVNVAGLLAQMPVPVPAILDHADDLGVIVLEDLGDVTLQAHLGVATPADHAALYRQAVALIEVLQRRGGELESDAYVPYRVAFDVEKLTWELDFFIKHFLQAYRGVVLDEATRAALRAEFALVVDELAAEPRVLCHRDYHSRNLMLHREELYIIDFQDARMGPDTYDLASLVRDSYVDLSDQTVEDLIAYFLALKGLAGREREFRERFDVMALQRNLKALGTFGYMTIARRNPVYIQYIPRTLRYVRDNLATHERFGRLHDIMGGLIDELR
ncbi:MAG TPA: phosphotransferase [Vicinamibacterales bacterium]|nr:phosphotransferase [Vicinamibacterales bacterium]